MILSEPNILYFLGEKLDYTALILDVDNRALNVVTHVLEYERAKRIKHINNIYLYSFYDIPIELKYIKGSIIDAILQILKREYEKGYIGVEGNYIPYNYVTKLQKEFPGKIIAIDDIIWKLRLVKYSDELELIRKSSRILSKVMELAIEQIRPSVKESEIASIVLHELIRNDAYTDIYPPIIASGPRSALPHGRATDKIVKEGEVVVLDLTSKYRGYYSDMTRTIAIKNIDNRLRRIYEAVKEAQEYALEICREGIKAFEVDLAARNVLKKYGLHNYFIHSTGHSLGLEIHEPLRIAQGVNITLKENMVITIEPGAYIPNLGGVRIEDTIIVRKNKPPEVLTSYTKELLIR